jgi:SNF2 family DNA or RNA helicase
MRNGQKGEVLMFEINEKFIRNSAANASYLRGLNYYKNGNVLSMDIEEENERTVIYSEVESSNYNFVYSVEVSFDSNRVLHIKCDCEAFNDYYRGGFCKHIVAVLFKYCREKEKYYKNKNSSLNSELINYLKGIACSNINNKEGSSKRLLNLEIKYELMSSFRDRISSFELKVGESRLYVVKNITEFIESVVYNKKLEFGKNFTYDPVVHSLTQEDREIVNFLNDVREIDKLLNIDIASSYYGGVHRLLNGKKAYITNTQLVKFFSIMKGKKIEVNINNITYKDAGVLNENLPLSFNLKLKASGGTALSVDGEFPQPLDMYGKVYFYENNIYIPSEEQIKVFIPLINAFAASKNKSVEFSDVENEELASLVIPSLKSIAENVNIDKKLKKKFFEESLKAEIYLDKEDKGISAEVKFKYGDIIINPLNDDRTREKDGILIRDVKKEMAITNELSRYKFKKKENVFQLSDEEDIIDFLTTGLNRLQESAEIFYTDSFKNIKIYSASNIKSGVRLNDEDFLEFNFSIEGVDRGELKNIFGALRQKKKYYKLKNGGFMDLESKELSDAGNLIEYLDIKDEDLSKDKITLSKYNALYIEEKIKNSSLNKSIERNKRFREMVNNIKEVSEMDFEVPCELQDIMRGYQKVGFKWLKSLAFYGLGGILADEMGLGKTLQAIAFIQSEALENGNSKKPALIVAPTSLVYNWESEVKKFAPSLNTLVISGSKKEREELFKEIEGSHMVITSYPLIRRDIDEYKNFKFSYCILDEAQQIKNSNSINAKSVKEINAKGYFALTGTPIENSLMELWSIFDFIMPGYLLSSNKFSQKYEIPIVKDGDKKAMEELNRHIKPFILRRLKKEVYSELPPKIEHRLIVDMTEEQKKLYAAYVAKLKQEIDDEILEKGFGKSKIKILAALTRLRQICCDPSVFLENFNGGSGKLEALDDVLEESIGEGHRILLFSQFTSVLKNIEMRLIRNKIEYMYLDGHTKSEERGLMVKEFNEGKGKVFLISLKAGGTGLNLTGADTVIHFDPWWNPAVEEQASDRAHRIGQKKTVEVIKLIAKGTIEEKIYDLQMKKKEIIKSVMDDTNKEELFISDMSQKEIEQLFDIS